MELADVKKAILEKKPILYRNLIGIPFGCTMRLANDDAKLRWQYFMELMDRNNRTVYIAKIEECTLNEQNGT